MVSNVATHHMEVFVECRGRGQRGHSSCVLGSISWVLWMRAWLCYPGSMQRREYTVCVSVVVCFTLISNVYRYALLVGSSTVMLDTFPYSGFSTHVEAFTMGVPVVTMPTPSVKGCVTSASRHHVAPLASPLRGRSQTAALYRAMGLASTPLIVSSVEDYVDVAVRVSQDEVWRASLSNTITSAVEALFHRDESVASWGEFLQRAALSASTNREQ